MSTYKGLSILFMRFLEKVDIFMVFLFLLFQFSLWDSEMDLIQSKLDGGLNFQFSLWDSSSKILGRIRRRCCSFNSLYEIHHQFWHHSHLPKYFQFSLWDSQKFGLNPLIRIIFQFSLWDSYAIFLKIFHCLLCRFQFSLWDSFQMSYICENIRCYNFQFSLWDSM